MAIHTDQLGNFFLSSQQFFYIHLDTLGKVSFANPFFLQHLGYSSSELAGQSFSLTIAHQDLDKYRQCLQACAREPDQPKKVLLRTMPKDNLVSHNHSWLWTCWEFSVIHNASHEVAGLQAIGYKKEGTAEDQQEIAAKRKILKAIFDSSTHVQFFVAPDYRILFFNKKAYDNALLLHQRELQVGDNMLEYARSTTSNVEEQFIKEFTRALRGETVMVKTEIQYNQQVSYWFQTEYHPVYENEQLTGVAISIADISEQKEYEFYIERQNKLLQHIAYIQSHKTRQPVSTILGLVSIFNKRELSEENEKLLSLLEVTARKLDSVIHEIVANSFSLDEKGDQLP